MQNHVLINICNCWAEKFALHKAYVISKGNNNNLMSTYKS